MNVGLNSLRGRFAITALLLVLLLLGVALYAEHLVTETGSDARGENDAQTALRNQLDSLQPPLRSAESLTYRYAISLDPHLSRQVIAQLQRVRAKAATLVNNPLAQGAPQLATTVEKFAQVLKQLERQVHALLGIIGDAGRRFPAMHLLTDNMFPINKEFFGAVSVALDEASGEREDDPVQRHIHNLLLELRYTWLQQTSTFRQFVADRSGAFGDPDAASGLASRNMYTYSQQLSELLDQLEKLSRTGHLGFQQSEMVEKMRDAAKRWSVFAEQATGIYASEAWRADLPALKQNVTPLLDRSWALVSQMQAELDVIARENVASASATSRTLSRFIWTFAGLMFVALGIGWLLFERVVRRPLKSVAGAMQAEAMEGRTVALEKVGLEETDTLINAFLLMRGQVRSRQLRIESILDNAGDGIVTIDQQGRVETFNQAAQQIFGIPAARIVGHNVSMLMPEPYSGEHDGYLARYVDSGEAHIFGRSREVTGLRDDGSVFPLELRVSELKLDDRVVFIGMLRDISERREAEDALHKAKAAAEDAGFEAQRKARQLSASVEELQQAQLELQRAKAEAEQAQHEAQDQASQLAESLTELQQAQQQLVESEKMASLGGLVAGIAHEINTPVGIGVTAASSLQERVERLRQVFDDKTMKRSDLQQFMDGVQEGVGILLSNLQRAAELVHSFKQVAVDQTSDSRRRFKLREYLDEVLLSLRPQLKKTHHKVTVDCPADLELNSYPGAMSQVITNLVTNSLIHAYGPDDVGNISIRVRLEGARVQIQYSDDGRGISAEHREQIFEPFFTTRRGQGGSGLGMHVVYNIVKQRLGGQIACDSELGKGTRFTLSIPYSD